MNVYSQERFSEEQRSRQPSIFSVIRALIDLFFSKEDSNLGLFGAFGYDLGFQFEHVKLKHARSINQRDIVLYIPDLVISVDHAKQVA